MRRRFAKRCSLAAPLLAAAALSVRVLVGCDSAAEGSTFGSAQDAGSEAAPFVPTPFLPGTGSADPTPTPPSNVLSAGPPVGTPVCNPSVARESCSPPESVFPLPVTIRVTPADDGGCRQEIYAEVRDGGGFACVIGSSTSCYGPLTLGTSYPFRLGHSSTTGDVTGTFTVRMDGDGGVPATVSLGGCFN